MRVSPTFAAAFDTWCAVLKLSPVALLLRLFAADAMARERSVIRAFRTAHACPSTGLHKGPCPDFRIDHVIPLCAGGADATRNLQWQDWRNRIARTKPSARCARGSGGRGI